MATRAEVDTLISNNLSAGNSKITATRHREVEQALVDYSASSIIATGYISIGDVNPGAQSSYYQSLGLILPTGTNYIVLAHYQSYSGNYSDDNDVTFSIINKTNSSFEVVVREYGGDDQIVSMFWMAINTGNTILTSTF